MKIPSRLIYPSTKIDVDCSSDAIPGTKRALRSLTTFERESLMYCKWNLTPRSSRYDRTPAQSPNKY